MTANRILLTIAGLIILLGASGCAPPPYDAKGMDESEMQGDVRPAPRQPAAGGGTVLRESQW